MFTFYLISLVFIIQSIIMVEYEEGLFENMPIDDFKKIIHAEKKAIICHIVMYDGLIEF